MPMRLWRVAEREEMKRTTEFPMPPVAVRSEPSGSISSPSRPVAGGIGNSFFP